MKLNELQPKEGSRKKKLIVGRGIGSGKGKTCGSGQKGQKARSGVAIKGFEGGQMPLYQRLPKMGFSNSAFRRNMAELTLSVLQAAIDSKKIDAKKAIDEDALIKAKIVRRKKDGIKLLAKGELKDKVDLQISGASKGAQAAVEKAGGKVTIVEAKAEPKKAAKKPAKKDTADKK